MKLDEVAAALVPVCVSLVVFALVIEAALKPLPTPEESKEYDLCSGTATAAKTAVETAWTLRREGPLGFWYISPNKLWRALVVVIQGRFVGILIEDAEGWVACHLEHPAPSPTPKGTP